MLAKDEDDDSNERDPFTDRSFNFFDLAKDTGPADRDIRHKFNFFSYFSCRTGSGRTRASRHRSAQPITASPRILNGNDRGRNGERKDNEYFSFDWRVARPFRFGGHYELIADPGDVQHLQQREQHQPARTPALFNFDGFLRTGVGDPRQVQLAVKFTF